MDELRHIVIALPRDRASVESKHPNPLVRTAGHGVLNRYNQVLTPRPPAPAK